MSLLILLLFINYYEYIFLVSTGFLFTAYVGCIALYLCKHPVHRATNRTRSRSRSFADAGECA